MPLALVVVLAAVIVWVAAVGGVHADVPKPQDIAVCNREALDAAGKGKDSRGTSPTAKDQSRAATARRDAGPADVPGGTARSADPQLDGMDAEGAKDAVYQAAYRTCMRRSGF